MTNQNGLTFSYILNSEKDDLIPISAFDNPNNEEGMPCKRTIDRMRSRKEIPDVKFSNRVFIRLFALREKLMTSEG